MVFELLATLLRIAAFFVFVVIFSFTYLGVKNGTYGFVFAVI